MKSICIKWGLGPSDLTKTNYTYDIFFASTIKYISYKVQDYGSAFLMQTTPIIETEAKSRLITHIHDLSISRVGPGTWRYSTRSVFKINQNDYHFKYLYFENIYS
jgi:carbohydrate-binding DOMON domain-containing protein